NLIGEAGESSSKEVAQAKEFQFFCGLFAAAEHAQIVELAADWCLAEVLGVSQKCEVAFPQEGGDDASNKHQHQPRRIDDHRDRHGYGGDDLLFQAANRLDHSQTIRGLDASALEAVVENRIFVGDEIQFRGVLHDFNADVAGVFFREQGIGIVDGAGQDAGEYGET